jgi:hypothetical protein
MNEFLIQSTSDVLCGHFPKQNKPEPK